MAKKLEKKKFSNGNVQYICPHCKKVIFEGFYMGITIHDIEGKCPHCNKEVITPWDKEFKERKDENE